MINNNNNENGKCNNNDNDKKKSQLLVSIIFPCHNVSNYLSQSLESLTKCTYRPLEIIIYNDCSTDNTSDMIREWIHNNPNDDNFTVIFAENLDPSLSSCAFARNSAILLSSGVLIANVVVVCKYHFDHQYLFHA